MTEAPTPHQLEVFELVCRLGSQQAAADALCVTRKTVSTTLSRMYQRIGADGLGHAAWLIWGSDAQMYAKTYTTRRP